jgi:hypothetical protein
MICLCPNTYAILSGIVPGYALTSIVRILRQFVAFLILCAIEATSGVFLFGSKPLLEHFGFAPVAQQWRSFFSLVFLLGMFLVILWMVVFFNRKVLDKWEEH